MLTYANTANVEEDDLGSLRRLHLVNCVENDVDGEFF